MVAFMLLGFGSVNEKLTDEERAKALTKLTETQEYLLKTVEGLSEEQLNYKSSPDAWSIANCVEHVTISENAIGEMLQGTLSTMADENLKASAMLSDEDVYALISGRDKKVTTSEPFEPSGKFGTYEETLAAFNAKRGEHIEFLKKSDDDFRAHYKEMPFGTIDGYQVVLFMAGHTERHVKQMEEVKADENFPQE